MYNYYVIQSRECGPFIGGERRDVMCLIMLLLYGVGNRKRTENVVNDC